MSVLKSPSEAKNRFHLRIAACETVIVGDDVRADVGSIAKKAQTREAGHTSSRTRFTKVVRFGDSGCARVAVVQPADLRDRSQFAHRRWLDIPWDRCIATQRLMRTRTVIVVGKGFDYSAQMGFVQDDKVVKTLST